MRKMSQTIVIAASASFCGAVLISYAASTTVPPSASPIAAQAAPAGAAQVQAGEAMVLPRP